MDTQLSIKELGEGWVLREVDRPFGPEVYFRPGRCQFGGAARVELPLMVGSAAADTAYAAAHQRRAADAQLASPSCKAFRRRRFVRAADAGR